MAKFGTRSPRFGIDIVVSRSPGGIRNSDFRSRDAGFGRDTGIEQKPWNHSEFGIQESGVGIRNRCRGEVKDAVAIQKLW